MYPEGPRSGQLLRPASPQIWAGTPGLRPRAHVPSLSGLATPQPGLFRVSESQWGLSQVLKPCDTGLARKPHVAVAVREECSASGVYGWFAVCF